MTNLSLFTGIGGLDLAAEAAGFVTVGQCEWADYPTKVLERHWPDVPRWRDIRTLTKESFYERTGLRTVTVISGGFPCQPFSCAGKQQGTNDDRYLWPEMFRVIRELRPAWVLCENVPGFVRLALEQTLSDLESIDYEVQTFIIPACGVDAPHKRERVAVVANANDHGAPGLQHRSTEHTEGHAAKGPDHREGVSELYGRERRRDQPGAAGMADGLREEVHGGPDPDAQGGCESWRERKPLLDTQVFTKCSSRERERGGGLTEAV